MSSLRMIDLERDFNVHTVHGGAPVQVAADDPVEVGALGLFFKHGTRVRMIPWSEITEVVQGSGTTT